MRFKTLLGLLAIGGAVAYARKRRGGDLRFEGIKNSLKGAVDNLRHRVDDLKATSSRSHDMTSAGTSDLGSAARSSVADEFASTSGYSGQRHDVDGLGTRNRKL